ncbi:MAG TPA: hypothetical protein GXZ60_15755 [Intrasporangiaceae bacterium]|nr:hypothetical protein [Intrasporangiaceae bacterium]
MSDRVEIITDPPSLATLFAKSVVTGLRKDPKAELPDTILQLEVQAKRDDLTSYQQVCGWGVSDVLPHTYPHVLGFPLQVMLISRTSFPLPLAGLVHVENSITVHRQLTADDVLTISVHAENLGPHFRGRVVDIVTEVDVEGERVWEGRSTYLARGSSSGEAPPDTAVPMPEGIPAARWRLPEDLGRTYAGVSGDVNPIHLHAITAMAMGFPRAIAHGMWTYARTLAAFGPTANGPSTSTVWFKKPVLLPSAVQLIVERENGAVVAGLRAARKPEIQHLILRLESH